jgi:hypothetical protein
MNRWVVPWLVAAALAIPGVRAGRQCYRELTGTHWISSSGIRHNKDCRYFKNCRGRLGPFYECQPCHLCGG